MRLFVYGRNEARPGENRPVTKYVPAVITLDRGPTCAPVPVPVLSELPNRRLMRTTRFWEVRARRCKGNFTSLRYPPGGHVRRIFPERGQHPRNAPAALYRS